MTIKYIYNIWEIIMNEGKDKRGESRLIKYFNNKEELEKYFKELQKNNKDKIYKKERYMELVY